MSPPVAPIQHGEDERFGPLAIVRFSTVRQPSRVLPLQIGPTTGSRGRVAPYWWVWTCHCVPHPPDKWTLESRRAPPPLPSEPYFSTLRMKSLKPRRLPSQSFRGNVSHFPSSPAALIPELLDQTTSDERDRTNRLFRPNLNSLTCSVKPATINSEDYRVTPKKITHRKAKVVGHLSHLYSRSLSNSVL